MHDTRRPHCGGGPGPLRATTAFTLIELLVVVAIIALLVTILSPSLNEAKTLARRAVCGSNFHQLHAAWLVYAADSRDRLPIMPHNSGPLDPFNTRVISVTDSYADQYWGGDWKIAEFIRPYAVPALWNCPEVNAPPIDDPRNTRAIACYGPLCYLPGNYHPLFDHAADEFHPQSIAEADGDDILMQDAVVVDLDSGAVRFNHGRGPRVQSRPDDNPSAMHLGSEDYRDAAGSHILRFSGSVQFRPASALADQGYTSHPWTTWRFYSVSD